MSRPCITDHALLRWMERAHGVDVRQWRALMIASLNASLDAYEGDRPLEAPAFVVADGRVVTFLDAGHHQSRAEQTGTAVPMV